MSRAALFTLLDNDAVLSSYGLTVYAFQAVDTPPSKPFAVIRWDEMQPGVAPTRGVVGVTVWVYDELADYTRIGMIIARIKEIVCNAVHVIGADGWTLTQAKWMGDSSDLDDNAYGCILRTTRFDVVTRPSS